MSLRFDRNTPPHWNARTSRVDFSCVDSQTRSRVPCAVSRAALEDSTGEALDGNGCVAMFARHLGRILAVANSINAAHRRIPGGMVVVDSDDLLQNFPVLDQIPVAAHELGRVQAHGAMTA